MCPLNQRSGPLSGYQQICSSKEDTSSSEIADAIPRPDVNQLLDLLDEWIQENDLKKIYLNEQIFDDIRSGRRRPMIFHR